MGAAANAAAGAAFVASSVRRPDLRHVNRLQTFLSAALQGASLTKNMTETTAPQARRQHHA